jgi:hypothetical protein
LDDIGFLEFETSKDLFRKLQHDYDALRNEQNCNNYFNFIFVAYHLSEWIATDETFTKDEKSRFSKLLEENNIFLFEDICNRIKHYKLTRKRNSTTKDEFQPGFNWNNFNWDNFRWGEIYLVEQDGNEIDINIECERIFSAYETIFKIR